MQKVHNTANHKQARKDLRNNATPAEKKLWDLLKGASLEGRKFRRQHSIGSYILDFYCPAERLAIELDGSHHYTADGLKHDERRTYYLNECFIKVIRFENNLVLTQPGVVIEEIKKHFK